MKQATKRKVLKASLIAAAEQLIAEQGWQSVKARAVAEIAGCALGAIYTAYPDLDALIMDVKSDILDGIEARMSDVERRSASAPLERLQALAFTYLDYAIAEDRRWKTLFEHHLPEGAELPEWYLPKLAMLFSHVDAPLAQATPHLLQAERTQLSHALFASVHGIITLGLQGRLGANSHAAIREQITLLLETTLAGLSTGK